MSRRLRAVLYAVVTLTSLTVLHVWLNIGFDRLGIGGQRVNEAVAQESFKVGFLPVT